jgi:hypothetical protein
MGMNLSRRLLVEMGIYRGTAAVRPLTSSQVVILESHPTIQALQS